VSEDHCLPHASGSAGVAEGEHIADLYALFEWLRVGLSTGKHFLVGEQPDAFFGGLFVHLLGDRIAEDHVFEVEELVLLKNCLEGNIGGKNGGQISLIKNMAEDIIGGVFIHGSHGVPIECIGTLQDHPLLPILGHHSYQVQLVVLELFVSEVKQPQVYQP